MIKSIIISLSLAITAQCADVVLGTPSGITWTQGTGANKIASFGSAFSPLSLSPSLWLDASDASTVTLSSSSVTNWTDKSTAGNNARFIGISSTWPTYCATQQNGRCTISFDGGDYLSTGFLSNTGTTIICVAKRTAGELIVGARDSTDTRSGFGSDASGNLRASVGADAAVNSTTAWGTTYHVFSGRHNGTTVVLRDAGAQVYSKAQSGVAYNFTQGYYIGCFNLGGGPAGYFTGFVGEILCFRRELTDAEMKQVETYLGTKWGITVAP